MESGRKCNQSWRDMHECLAYVGVSKNCGLTRTTFDTTTSSSPRNTVSFQ